MSIFSVSICGLISFSGSKAFRNYVAPGTWTTLDFENTINLVFLTLMFSPCFTPAARTLLINCWKSSMLSQKIKISSEYLIYVQDRLTFAPYSVSSKASLTSSFKYR